MEHIESKDTSPTKDLRFTKQRWESKFSELRQEANDMAARHRQRLNHVLERSGATQAPSAPPVPEPAKQAPVRKVPPPPRRRERRPAPRQNFDRIALWSTVAPSTIAAVFAGVAMSGNNVPLGYALGFVLAWFVLTTALAIGAVKLFSSRECIAFLKSSSPRLGAAAITCALVAVLAVELAHISITAIAPQPPQQISGTIDPPVTPVRAANGATNRARSQTVTKVASAGSVHFRTTPNLIDPSAPTSVRSGAIEKRVVALPAPTVQHPLETPEVEVPSAPSPNANDQLLGQISAKGKYVARRTSSRWTRSAKQQNAAPSASRNLFEKIFDPVINSASATAEAGRVGTEISDQEQMSR